MGKSMNMNNLTPEEAQQILLVIQKDFELRQKEKARLAKIEEVINEEDSKTEVLTKQRAFNENCCIRCCQTFGVIFNRKQLCLACKLFVCKSCAEYDDSIKGYHCKACLKEIELKQKSCDWFYDNVSRRFKRFGSAKVVRTLHKHSSDSRSKFHSDNESDSGYDPSLYSSFGQSGSSVRVKSRPSLQAAFPEIVINDEADDELDNGLYPPPPLTHLSPNGHTSPNTSLESLPSPRDVPTPTPRLSVTTPTQTTDGVDNNQIKDERDIYKEAFEKNKRTEEAKFKVRFDNILADMQQSFETLSPRDGQVPSNFGSSSYGDLMTTYRGRVKELLVSLSQRLELAVESFDETCANNPALTSQKVRQMISKLIEDRLGESLDLTSDEAVSDLSSLSDDSGEHKSFEDQIAQAVIARVLELHRNITGLPVNFDDVFDNRDTDSPVSGNQNIKRVRNLSYTISDNKQNDKQRDSSFSEDKDSAQSRNSSVSEERLLDKNGNSPTIVDVNCDNSINSWNEDRNTTSSNENSVHRRLSGGRHVDTNKRKHSDIRNAQNDDSANDEDVEEKVCDEDFDVFDGAMDEEADTSGELEHQSANLHDKQNNSSLVASAQEPSTNVAVNEKKLIQEEFEKLRSFAKEVVPRPLYEEAKFVEEIEPEPIEESIECVQVDHEESQHEFSSRFNTYDKIHDSDQRGLPDFSDLDYEFHDFGINEVDPDLLSMNLAPILEETEEELEDDKDLETQYEQDWRGNWIFKGASGMDSFADLSKNRIDHREFSASIMVPKPGDEYTPKIGNKWVEDVSDMSENEDRDSDGLSDEENSFYSKTSEEIARITRKSVSSNAPQTDGDSEAESTCSRPYSSSFSDAGTRGQRLDQTSFESRSSEQPQLKLSEELVQAEGDDPKFEIPPISVTVPEGEPAKLTCRVSGTQPLDVFWYRVRDEVEELENSENYDIVKEGNRHHLTMYNMLRTEHAGQYMCMAMNEKGRCCQYFILAMKKNTQELKAPEFLKQLSDLEVREGQSVKFRVKVKGYPQPRVVWFKDGQLLLNQLNYKIEKFGNRDYLLTIDSASMDEDAEYSVLAKNIAGEVRSSAQLIVEPKHKPETENETKAVKAETTMTPKKKVQKRPSSPEWPELSYLPNRSTAKSSASSSSPGMKKSSPGSQKDEHNLTNINQKVVMTKESVTEVAEDMLSSSKELSEIDRSIAAMDKILADIEGDMSSVGSDDQEKCDLDFEPEVKGIRGMVGVDSYKVLETAKNVRKATSSVLDYLNNTDSMLVRAKGMDAPATSTPRNSDTERVFNPDNNGSVLGSESDVTMETQTSDESHKSEISFSFTPKTTSDNKSKTDRGRQLERGESDSSSQPASDSSATSNRDNIYMDLSAEIDTTHNSSHNTSDRSDPLVVNLGPKRENKERYTRDFYITDTPTLARRTPPTSPRDAPDRTKMFISPPTSPREEEHQSRSTLTPPISPRMDEEDKIAHTEEKVAHTEEKIYLAASNVYGLENKVQSLQDKMRALNALQEQDRLAKLECQVASTVAQVSSSDKQVTDIEKSVQELQQPKLTKLNMPAKTAVQYKSKQAPKPPPQRPITPPPEMDRPEPTFLKGSTQEDDLPESRTEFNEDYGEMELPSVSRLKAMFGQDRGADKDSSIKRIHSITARSVPKEQLEQLRDTTDDSPRSRVAKQQARSAVSNPGRATSLTTGQQIKQVPNMPKQVYQSSDIAKKYQSAVTSKPQTNVPKQQVPKQSIQTSSNAKNQDGSSSEPKVKQTMNINLSSNSVNRPLNPVDNARAAQSSKTSGTKSTRPSTSQSHAGNSSAVKAGSVENETGEEHKASGEECKEERKAPKIKTGAISAMSKLWEKRAKEKVTDDDIPDILEYQ